MASTKELFLSYGREAEVVDFVKKLKRDLEADGFGVWLDQDDIPAGCDWHAAVGSGLEHCRALLAVVTPKYVTSRFCTSELYVADGDMKPIFPIFFADTDLASSERARGVKYVISGINWTMFRPNVDDYEMSLEKLKFGLAQRNLRSPTPSGDMPGQARAPTSSGSAADGLTAAVGQMTLSSPAPAPVTASPSTEAPGAAPVPPSAPSSLGADDVDGTGLPSYDASLLLQSVASPQQSQYSGPGHPYPSPGQNYPGHGQPYPGQVHPYPAHGQQYPYLGQGQPYPGQGPVPGSWGQAVPDGTSPQYQYSPYGMGLMNQPYSHPTGYPPPSPGAPGQQPGAPGQQPGVFTPPPGSAYSTPTHPAHRPVFYSDSTASPGFRSPAPVPQAGSFSIGQRLEAVDRAEPQTVCVSTIMEISEKQQLLIHFDGGSNESDYWCDPLSPDLHPVGWAANSRQPLRPPQGVPTGQFNWFQYLSVMQAQAAPHHLFSESQRSVAFTQPPTPARGADVTSPSRADLASASNTPVAPQSASQGSRVKVFAPNMVLEFDDPTSSQTYPCHVLKVDDSRKIRLHYEGWSDSWDFWTDIGARNLHPPGWCSRVGRTLQTPDGFVDWNQYVRTHGYTLAPDYLFTEDQRVARTARPELKNVGVSVLGLTPGMAVEVDDPASPSLTYLCSIVDVDADAELVRVHYEGWDRKWDFWLGVRASAMHHMGWCATKGRTLGMPNGDDSCWRSYLAKANLVAAGKEFFDHVAAARPPRTPTAFARTQALEIDDPADPSKTYLGAIVEVRGGGARLKVTYIGWSNTWDYEVDTETSTAVHPIGWCDATGRSLHMPGNANADDVDSYLTTVGLTAAPANLFTRNQKRGMPEAPPIVAGVNRASAGVAGQLRVGMRLEAVDVKHPSLTCVASIQSIQADANRVEIYFDGWSTDYNYWCAADDGNIHPVGWCEANGRSLQNPQGLQFGSWQSYLERNAYTAMPRSLFTDAQKRGMSTESIRHTTPSIISQLRVGMRLEALDIQNPSLMCVASIRAVDTANNRIEIYFDGWSNNYNYWCSLSDGNVHPVGWCAENHRELQPPHGLLFENWHSYMSRNGYTAVPKSLFADAQRSSMATPVVATAAAAAVQESLSLSSDAFKVGMRLEAVDRKNPGLVCVASIASIEKGKRVDVHFDGWTDQYNYWCDVDDSDLHPVGWCEQNGRSVTPPHNVPFKSWHAYLCDNGFRAVPYGCFQPPQRSGMFKDHFSASEGQPPFLFSVGMRLEAKDRKNEHMTCAANVISVNAADRRIEINFDGWSASYDYWCSAADPDLHPIGWCGANGVNLNSPRNTEFGSWVDYLSRNNYKAVPFEGFTTRQTAGMTPRARRFSPGMRLEARDRLNPHMMCVATVAMVEGSRLMIHFDGWTSKYDYWCSPATDDIHPIGWCDRFGFTLQPPKGRSKDGFHWNSYLKEVGAIAAPKNLFVGEGSAQVGCFMKNMKLEAKDPQNPRQFRVVTIAQVREGKLLIHFDGSTGENDFWCERSSTDIHPIGWCALNGLQLEKPIGHSGRFVWSDYLEEQHARAVPTHLFTEEQHWSRDSLKRFTENMRLEAKDRKNPTLICVATITQVRNDGKELLIHFDGWTSSYDYWCQRDTHDIHPVGWCAAHGIKLQAPKGKSHSSFNWIRYLTSCHADQAPKACFAPASLRGPR